MKLTVQLKEHVEEAENREQAKKILEEAGVVLNDSPSPNPICILTCFLPIDGSVFAA